MARLPSALMPMLAKSLDKALLAGAKVAEGPYYASPKLDGVRCVFTRRGAFSRRRFPLHGLDHIRKDLAPLFRADPSLVLDGEIFSKAHIKSTGGFERVLSVITALRSSKLVEALRRSQADSTVSLPKGLRLRIRGVKSLQEFSGIQRSLAFYVFDVIRMNEKGSATRRRLSTMHGGAFPPVVIPNRTPFFAREWAMQSLFNGPLRRAKHVIKVPQKGVGDLAQARKALQQYLGQRYEGCVLRTFDNVYSPGKRSKTLLKMVPWHDKEFKVLRIIAAKDKATSRRRSAGSPHRRRKAPKGEPSFYHRTAIRAVECIADNGTVFRAHVGVPDPVARKWLQLKDDLTGVYATVRFPSQTRRGVPRFAVVKGLRGRSVSWFL